MVFLQSGGRIALKKGQNSLFFGIKALKIIIFLFYKIK
jgi:hypothetical protein